MPCYSDSVFGDCSGHGVCMNSTNAVAVVAVGAEAGGGVRGVCDLHWTGENDFWNRAGEDCNVYIPAIVTIYILTFLLCFVCGVFALRTALQLRAARSDLKFMLTVVILSDAVLRGIYAAWRMT